LITLGGVNEVVLIVPISGLVGFVVGKEVLKEVHSVYFGFPQ
jgi:hypothetical protein